ncbi:MAG TPA: alpha/beta hydrolase domain-containing protein [Acidimicrobiales bacterium]
MDTKQRTILRDLGTTVVVAVLLLGAAGCSSSKDSASHTGTTATTSDGSAASTTAVRTTAADLLPAADVPVAKVSGPITGGSPAVPFNSLPSDVAASTGYTEHEFFLSGTARSFRQQGSWGSDGKWTAVPDKKASYRTRMIVRRPADPAKFNGTVIVEWLNVSAGMDSDPDFGLAHDELLRDGYAYVGVSVQKVGVMGGGGLLPVPGFTPKALRQQNPGRYGSLHQPGDDYSYDIFAQAAEAVRHPAGLDPLGGLARKHVIGDGESQSAFRMVTFVDAIQPITHVFDGFLIHSRAGNGDELNKAEADKMPKVAFIRSDTSVPVFQFETETDLFVLGFYPARQADTDKVRTWEVAGTSHADASVLNYGLESGKVSAPDERFDIANSCGPINAGPQTYVLRAAIAALNAWVAKGTPPPAGPPIDVVRGVIQRDADGNVLGGVRSPAVDAPIATLSGEHNAKPGIFCQVFGSTTPYTPAHLAQLYPTHATYVAKVKAAATAAVKAGHLLRADATIIDGLAATAKIPS